ncbi:MAG: fibrillarin-like rRNA/tRNA 2'-O-methyltransferase [Candidatus Helarchaeota archaeon]
MTEEIIAHKKFPGLYWITLEDGIKRLATINLVPGKSVYDEKLININNVEYRLWNPRRSKLAAGVFKEIKNMPIHHQTEENLLYLGSASGTTVSHISDIMGSKATLYCVEFAHRVMRDFVELCEVRPNLIPVFGDVRFPEKYAPLVEQIDVLYSDVAQPEQAQILANNAKWFLRQGGWSFLCVKSRSVDVTMDPQEIYKNQIKILEHNSFEIIEVTNLDPYSGDHALVISKYQP